MSLYIDTVGTQAAGTIGPAGIHQNLLVVIEVAVISSWALIKAETNHSPS